MNAISKVLFVCLCSILSITNVFAENYPYKSDFLWVTVPDHDNWLYKTGEKANVEIQLYQYGIPCNVEVSYEIGGDEMPADDAGKLKLKNGRAVLNIGTMKQPGFRDLRLTAVVDGKKVQHHVKVGFSPEKLVPYTKLPKDFNDFWNKQMAELAKFPLKYTMEKSEMYSTEDVDYYLVRLEINKQKQCIYGYLSMPKKPGKYPVVLCPPGAGIKTIKEPANKRYYAENGFIRFEMEIHGLNPELSAEVFAEISAAFSAKENGYVVNGLDNRDNYYMKHVYMSCIRAIDFLTSLPQWDGKNVAVQGGSQGGALALITAALDKRVNLCVANHPALSDIAGYLANRAGGWPHLNRIDGMLTPEKVNTLSYYDVVNFARQIKAKTFMTWGYNDDTCPPTTSYIVWNTITAKKEALVTPINEHWTSENTNREQMQWIKANLK